MFYIQVSNPRYAKLSEKVGVSFEKSIENKFLLFNESAIMMWNIFFIPINYNCAMGELYQDIMDMLSDLEEGKKHVYVVFPSSCFQADWSIAVNGNMLDITARWGITAGGDDYIDLLNRNNTLTVNKDDFIGEWNSLLETVYNAFSDDDMTECEEYQRLGEYLKTHKQRGILYREYQPVE